MIIILKPPSLWPSHDQVELKKATPAGHNTGGGGLLKKDCQKIKFCGSAIVHTVYLNNMLTGESGTAHARVACRNHDIRISPLSRADLRASA